jgi:hypothetical protein
LRKDNSILGYTRIDGQIERYNKAMTDDESQKLFTKQDAFFKIFEDSIPKIKNSLIQKMRLSLGVNP